MLQNYFKIALRTLRKHKGYSFINIFGLAVGLACCFLILLFVQEERSYDQFHDNADRIFRVATSAQPPNDAPLDRFAVTARVVGHTLREDFPEVEAVTRINPWNPSLRVGDEQFYGEEFGFVESSFFEMFTFPFVAGGGAGVLDEPNSVVLSETTARKIFGTTDAVDRTVTLNDSLDFVVTGVMADIPENSHMEADVFVSYAWLRSQNEAAETGQWLNLNGYVYILLKEGVNWRTFEDKIRLLTMDRNGEQLTQIGFHVTHELQPLPEIYLYSDRQAEIGPTGDASYVVLFSAVALFVLLIACINFMNLATARSMERAKEVGIRKVVGSTRAALVRQFLAESVLLCLVALVLAMALIAAVLPLFNTLAEKELAYTALLTPGFLAGLLGVTLVVGLLAGSYPAFVLSSFRPVQVLKGAFRTSSRGAVLRKGLVVFQFAISVALIASTLIVFSQLDYMKSRDLGFTRDPVLVVDAQSAPGNPADHYERTKAEFARLADVRQVSASNTMPGNNAWLLIYFAEGLPDTDSRRAQVAVVDHDYVETYGMTMAAGRDFSAEFETDLTEAVMVNELLVEQVGWGTPEEALGKTIRLNGQTRTVVGVLENYHHNSLKLALEPMIFAVIPQTFAFYSLRLDTDNLTRTMSEVERTWERLFPEIPFNSFFLDDNLDQLYRTEQRLSRIFTAFAGLAILIACLGLFGLAAFTAQQRRKEIGVRKVLGATVPGIIGLLSKEFTALVTVAVVVAIPLTYYGMGRWLETFPYHTEIGANIFLVTGLIAVAIAFLTISYQALRAALTDPVRALRYE